LVIFPELAFTTFFPRWFFAEQSEIDSFFETKMPGPETIGLFDEAKRLGIAFCIGYAELVEEGGRKHRFNTSILVDKSGRIVGSIAKCIYPGTPITGRSGASSIWRSATSSPATSDFRFGARWAA
jgi:N-carbamoyl-D-amino-acid hydrolase